MFAIARLSKTSNNVPGNPVQQINKSNWSSFACYGFPSLLVYQIRGCLGNVCPMHFCKYFFWTWPQSTNFIRPQTGTIQLSQMPNLTTIGIRQKYRRLGPKRSTPWTASNSSSRPCIFRICLQLTLITWAIAVVLSIVCSNKRFSLIF